MPPSGYPKTTLDLGFLYLLLSLPLLLLLLTTLSCTLVISFFWSPGGQDGFLKRPNRATTAAYGHTKNDTHTSFFFFFQSEQKVLSLQRWIGNAVGVCSCISYETVREEIYTLVLPRNSDLLSLLTTAPIALTCSMTCFAFVAADDHTNGVLVHA